MISGQQILISSDVKRDVQSTKGMFEYDKVSKLFEEVRKSLKACNENQVCQVKLFEKLCEVLQNQNDPVLSMITDKMLKMLD